jgi:hypothetical protein
MLAVIGMIDVPIVDVAQRRVRISWESYVEIPDPAIRPYCILRRERRSCCFTKKKFDRNIPQEHGQLVARCPELVRAVT